MIHEIPRILLLEDDDEFRTLLAEVLEDEGYAVSAVNRGEAAVALAGSENFDLIIADIRMDGIGGLEALEQTQQLQPGIGSLIVSGYASELETARAEHLDVGAYLQKPFQMQDLLKFVRSELASKSVQSKKQAKDSFMRQALDWALTKMAQAIDESGSSEGSLESAADSAERMAKVLGSDPELCLSARWATLFLGAQRLPGAPLPDCFGKAVDSLPALHEIVERLNHHEATASDSQSVQLVALALSAHLDQEQQSPKERERKLESQFSAPVWQAYLNTRSEQACETPLPLEVRLGLQRSPGNYRSLVSLAHTLERLGDVDNSKNAYLKLSEEDVSERERLIGLLGLSRLASTSGDIQACRNSALAALKIAKNRGPVSLAKHGLEAALLLEKSNSPEAHDALNMVGQAAKAVGFSLGLALVRCAFAGGSENRLTAEHLAPLFGPDSFVDLARYLDWTIPHLFHQLDSESSTLYQPLLVRIAQDFSPAFLRFFDTARCPVATRTSVARALATARYLPESITSRLLNDTEKAVREIGNELHARRMGKKPTNLLRVQSFGNPTIHIEGEPVDETQWRTRKVKYLFFLLASRWGETLNEDKLIDTFWPKAHHRNKKNLYWATSGVRSILKRAYSDEFDPLVRFQHTLGLDPDAPRWHDLEEFQRTFRQAHGLDEGGHLDGALEHYTAAAAAYVGPYLDGCYYDFAVSIKQQTEEEATRANLRASEIYLDRNLDALALEHATNAVEMAPFREDGRIAKMRALIRLGKGDTAIEEYQQICQILMDDYEAEPSLELVELYQRARFGFTDA